MRLWFYEKCYVLFLFIGWWRGVKWADAKMIEAGKQ